MKEERFQELLEAFVDRTLDEGGARELHEGFAADGAMMARFVEELRVANLLHGFRDAEGERVVSEVLESIRLGGEARDLSGTVISELKPRASVGGDFPIARMVLGLAATIAFAFLILYGLSHRGEEGDDALARLGHVEGATWADEVVFSLGDALEAGRVRLLSGVARLDFANGVRVTLEGPAEFELIGPGETRLHSGALTAHVPPEGIGFQVHTEKIEVTDLGTTFGVSVGDDGATDVLVFEGKVEVAPPAGKKAKREKGKIIHEGDAVSVRGGSTAMEASRFEPRSFRNGWPVLFGIRNTGGRIKFVNAQPIGNPREVVDRENIIVFPERFHVKPPGDVVVTISEPGRYKPRDLVGRQEVIRLSDERVNTYLLQYNPPHVPDIPNSEQVPFTGEVTFDRPILAVIAEYDQLRGTDGLLGKPRFVYEAGIRRGLEHGDSLTLSEDRRTLGIDWLVMQALEKGMDQIRVIVDAGELESRP